MRSKSAGGFLDPMLSGFDRTATEQAKESLQQALRVLELVPVTATELTPHPLAVVRAEIENAKRYLALVVRSPNKIRQPRLRLMAAEGRHH